MSAPPKYRKFLLLAQVKAISDRLREEGDEATVTPAEARELINSWSSWGDHVKRLLTVLGDLGKCSTCGAVIRWCQTKGGKRIPITLTGVPHFADCPQAREHRRDDGKPN